MEINCLPVKIIRLINPNSDEINLISGWYYNWWGKNEGWCKEKMKEYVKTGCSDKTVPATFVCKVGSNIVGACQIIFTNTDVRQDLSPWLSNLYIDEKYRKKGYSKLLINETINYSKQVGIKELFLYTEIKGMYEKYGFKLIDQFRTYDDEEIHDLFCLKL